MIENNNSLIVGIHGDISGLNAALDNGCAALTRFSQDADNVLQNMHNSTNDILKKIEKNTGGTLLFLQRITVAAHGVTKAFTAVKSIFSSFIKDAKDATSEMTDVSREKAFELEESVLALSNVAKSAKDEFVSELAPYITGIIKGMSVFVGWIKEAIVACPFLSKVLGALAAAIGIVTVAMTIFNFVANLNPFVQAATIILGVVTLLSTAAIAWYGSTKATDDNTNAIIKNAEAEKKLAEEKERAAEAERKKEEAARKALEAQKGIAASEKNLADAGKSSAQKEVEKIDEEIKTFQTNWNTRKNWLVQQNRMGNLSDEEKDELKLMTRSRYTKHIKGLQNKQDQITLGLSHFQYVSSDNPESDAVRTAQDNLDALRARGASAPEVAQAEKAVKEAEKRFTQVALQSSGEEKKRARDDYEYAKKQYENSGDKNEFEREELYKAMVEAQKKSQEADANFTRLAEENYKMHEVKIPEYEYKSVGGTFNAFAVAALGADIPKQQLEVLQQVAGKMDDIINNQQEAGVFA